MVKLGLATHGCFENHTRCFENHTMSTSLHLGPLHQVIAISWFLVQGKKSVTSLNHSHSASYKFIFELSSPSFSYSRLSSPSVHWTPTFFPSICHSGHFKLSLSVDSFSLLCLYPPKKQSLPTLLLCALTSDYWGLSPTTISLSNSPDKFTRTPTAMHTIVYSLPASRGTGKLKIFK